MSEKSKLRRLAETHGYLEQVAALPYRFRDDKVEFLVITSRRRKRLIIPKGWQMPGKSDYLAAAIEADQKAGVKGIVSVDAMGFFEYIKDIGGAEISVSAAVFPMLVKKVKSDWKERKERKRKWLTPEQAVERLDDGGRRELVRRYAADLENIGNSPFPQKDKIPHR